MRRSDLPAVLAVAAEVHPDYPEDAVVLAERLALFPDGCRVLASPSGVTGYLIAHPWCLGPPPALDTLIGALPARPNALHLHDLALLPAARGSGAARAAVEHAVALAATLGPVSLVAVGNAGAFWSRMGFRTLPPTSCPALAAYGSGAVAMIRA